jgi:hypothetical protein
MASSISWFLSRDVLCHLERPGRPRSMAIGKGPFCLAQGISGPESHQSKQPWNMSDSSWQGAGIWPALFNLRSLTHIRSDQVESEPEQSWLSQWRHVGCRQMRYNRHL